MKLYEPTIAILMAMILLFQGYSAFHEYKKSNPTIEKYVPDDNPIEEMVEFGYQSVTGVDVDISKRSQE